IEVSQYRSPHVAQQAQQIGVEARRGRAVDHPVIVGERQGQDQPGDELLAIPYRARARATYAEDRNLGRVDDRREIRAADATQARYRKTSALHVGGTKLAFARLRGQL